MKTLVLVIGYLVPGAALACWSCDGMNEEECGRQIKAGQEKTVLEMVAKNHEFCDGKSEGFHKNYLGREIGMVSTDPQVLLYCSGNGDKGWVVASYDGNAKQAIDFYPLGGNRDACAAPSACMAEKRNVATLIESAKTRAPNTTNLYTYTYSGLRGGAWQWLQLHGGAAGQGGNGNSTTSNVSQLGAGPSGQNVQMQAGP